MCKAQLFRPELIKEKAKDIRIVYTPLHGTGAMHVEKVLGDLGLKVITVPEQREPDGNFPTVEKPNPEEKPALKMAVELGTKTKADCVMATDPDSDRFGTAFPDKNGNFVLLSGNQMGALLMDFSVPELLLQQDQGHQELFLRALLLFRGEVCILRLRSLHIL